MGPQTPVAGPLPGAGRARGSARPRPGLCRAHAPPGAVARPACTMRCAPDAENPETLARAPRGASSHREDNGYFHPVKQRSSLSLVPDKSPLLLLPLLMGAGRAG